MKKLVKFIAVFFCIIICFSYISCAGGAGEKSALVVGDLFEWTGDEEYVSPKHADPVDAVNQSTGLQDNWWAETAFYHIWVKSFYDSDSDGCGDFAGIEAKLNYIQNTLGCDGIWLSPIFECSYKSKSSSNNMHGYDVVDHYSVNSYFGSEADLISLIQACHARNMKIIFDFVPNHTADKHPWFLDSAKGTEKTDWFLWNDKTLGWNPGMGTSNTWHSNNSKYYYGAFGGSMPDLNYRNYEVREEMKNVVRYWLNKGFDGIRVDAVRYLIEEDGVYTDTTESHNWYKELRDELDKYESPKFMVCEAWIEGNRNALDKYFGNGEEFHMVFDFDQGRAAVNTAENTSDKTGSTIRANPSVADSKVYGTFIGNHDEYLDRIGTALHGDLKKINLATALSLLRPTVPFIYYGQEIAQNNEALSGDIRLRGPFKWDLVSDSNSTLKLNNAILTMRKEEGFKDTFTSGKVIKLSAANGILAYVIDGATVDLLCVYNLSETSKESVSISGISGNYTTAACLIGGEDANYPISINGATATVKRLGPKAYRCYLLGSSSASKLFSVDEGYDEEYIPSVGSPVEFRPSSTMYLRGSMNSWGGTPMTVLSETSTQKVWQVTVTLTAGTEYEFKFCVDNSSSWGQNWGENGVLNGNNIKYTPGTTGNYIFTFTESSTYGYSYYVNKA